MLCFDYVSIFQNKELHFLITIHRNGRSRNNDNSRRSGIPGRPRSHLEPHKSKNTFVSSTFRFYHDIQKVRFFFFSFFLVVFFNFILTVWSTLKIAGVNMNLLGIVSSLQRFWDFPILKQPKKTKNPKSLECTYYS